MDWTQGLAEHYCFGYPWIFLGVQETGVCKLFLFFFFSLMLDMYHISDIPIKCNLAFPLS